MIALVDGIGVTVAEYAYDAWGNLLTDPATATNPIAYLNPLRYRGYVYDTETELYYLQSRYYNPETGRFINADNYTTTGQGLIGNNMFSYCENDPVLKKDPNGKLGVIALCAIGGILNGLVEYAGQVINNYQDGKTGADLWLNVNWGKVASSAFSGAISAIPGAGFVATAIDIVGSAAIEQGVNCAVAKFDNDPNTNLNWSTSTFLWDVATNAASEVASVALEVNYKVPKYIRDIKDEARAVGVKGTKKLKKYLNLAQVSTITTNTFYSHTAERLYPW